MLRSLSFGSSVRIIIVIAVATSVGVTLLLTLAPEPDSRKLPPRIPFAQTARISAGSGPMPGYGAGTVRPSAEIDIAPQVGGRVIWADTGFQSERRVEDGGTLLRIEEADYLYRLQEAEASLASHAVEVAVPLSDPDASLIPGLRELQAGDGEGIYVWDGYVERVEASLDAQTRTVGVIARVSAPFNSGAPASGSSEAGARPPLLVGKFVDVEIDGVSPEDYFRMPRTALQTGNEV